MSDVSEIANANPNDINRNAEANPDQTQSCESQTPQRIAFANGNSQRRERLQNVKEH